MKQGALSGASFFHPGEGFVKPGACQATLPLRLLPLSQLAGPAPLQSRYREQEA